MKWFSFKFLHLLTTSYRLKICFEWNSALPKSCMMYKTAGIITEKKKLFYNVLCYELHVSSDKYRNQISQKERIYVAFSVMDFHKQKCHGSWSFWFFLCILIFIYNKFLLIMAVSLPCLWENFWIYWCVFFSSFILWLLFTCCLYVCVFAL